MDYHDQPHDEHSCVIPPYQKQFKGLTDAELARASEWADSIDVGADGFATMTFRNGKPQLMRRANNRDCGGVVQVEI